MQPSVAVAIYRSCIQPMWEHLWRSGSLLGMQGGGKLKRLERLEVVFADTITRFDSRIYGMNGDTLRAEITRH